jgi:hypothetical protein
MEINLINIFITLIGYFGAIYTKDIIISIKKQKLILRKLTSYNNLIKKSILSQKDIAIIYCSLVDKHIKERINHLESFDKYKNFLDEYEKNKEEFIEQSKIITNKNIEKIFEEKSKFNENWNKELIENLKNSKKDIIGITDDEAGEIDEYMCELIIELKSNVTSLLSSTILLYDNLKSLKEFETELIEKNVNNMIRKILDTLESCSKIDKHIEILNKRTYSMKIKEQIFKNTF